MWTPSEKERTRIHSNNLSPSLLQHFSNNDDDHNDDDDDDDGHKLP